MKSCVLVLRSRNIWDIQSENQKPTWSNQSFVCWVVRILEYLFCVFRVRLVFISYYSYHLGGLRFSAQAAGIRAVSWAFLVSSRLVWALLGSPSSPVLFWARLGSPGLVWAPLGSPPGLSWAPWAFLGSFGLYWARLDSSKVNLVILSLGFMKFTIWFCSSMVAQTIMHHRRHSTNV